MLTLLWMDGFKLIVWIIPAVLTIQQLPQNDSTYFFLDFSLAQVSLFIIKPLPWLLSELVKFTLLIVSALRFKESSADCHFVCLLLCFFAVRSLCCLCLLSIEAYLLPKITLLPVSVTCAPPRGKRSSSRG